MENKIKLLKTFFTITNATFELHKAMIIALGKNYIPSDMSILHKQVLIELDKENPNWVFIDSVLKEMEDLAESNKLSK